MSFCICDDDISGGDDISIVVMTLVVVMKYFLL